jgi:cobalt/nickel transport protein
MSRVSSRAVLLGLLLAALLIAGVVSYYASSSPDGLNRVAADQGFAGTEQSHGTADGPLAGYGIRGVSDPRASTAVAGVAGSLVVLVLAGGLAFAVRRRGRASDDEPASQKT